MSAALTESSVCLFCGTSVSSGSGGSPSLVLEANVGAKWKAECAQVLSGILSTPGHVEVIKELLEEAKYCRVCDLRNKDLCWSFTMMEKLRNSMAEAVGGVVDIICGHHERLSRKKVTRSVDAVKEALKVIIDELEASGCPGVSTKETGTCLLNKLENAETPKVNRNVDTEVVDGDEEMRVETPDETEDEEMKLLLLVDDSNEEEAGFSGNTGEIEINTKKRNRKALKNEMKDTRSNKKTNVLLKYEQKPKIAWKVQQKSTRVQQAEKSSTDSVGKLSKTWRCTVDNCGYRTYSSVILDGHYQKIHLGNPRPFKCDSCDLCYASLQTLNLHVVREHQTGIRQSIVDRFKCTICSKSFPSKQSLGGHFIKEHRKAVRHFCDVCGKGFLTEEEVAGHKERIHVGYKPFKCEDCRGLKVFGDLASLLEHRETVHPVEQAKGNECNICGATVGSEKNLQVHKRRIHPEAFGITWKCSYCPATFKTFYMRRGHQTTQHPEMVNRYLKFPCQTCGEKFNTWADLGIHLTDECGESSNGSAEAEGRE